MGSFMVLFPFDGTNSSRPFIDFVPIIVRSQSKLIHKVTDCTSIFSSDKNVIDSGRRNRSLQKHIPSCDANMKYMEIINEEV